MPLPHDVRFRNWFNPLKMAEFFLALSVWALPPNAMAIAQSAGVGPATLLAFDIPPQPLASALEVYSTVTGVTAVYNGNLGLGRQSAGVRGQYSPEAALRLLLAGSGLAAQYTATNAFVLVARAAEEEVVKSPSAIALNALSRQDLAEQHYSGLVQSVITRLLCNGRETRPGDYRLAMSFRIASSGKLSQLRLLGSTGDQQRDAAVMGALQNASFDEPPPASMAQPFTMIMLPRSSGGVIACPINGGRQNG